MAMINIPTPDLSGTETVEKKIDSLLDSYIMLRKELQYGLQNLSAENFTSVFNKTLKGNMGETAQMKFDVEGLEIRFNNLDGDFSSLTQTIDGIESIVSKTDGRISSLSQTVNGFDLRVQNAEGNISALTLTVNDFTVRIGNAEGDISTLEQTASTLSTRIGNAEGDLSTLTQTVNSFSTRIESTEMSVADVMQGLEAVEGSIVTTFYLSYYPTGAKSGDLLYHTSNKKTYRYNGSAWNLLEDKGINDALGAAQTAQSTADGKIVTYYQSNQPSTSIAKLGDIWINTGAKNKMYRFNGTSWVDIQDKNISELIQTSSSLTSRISSVEGDVSTIEQTVGGIALAVNNSKLTFDTTGLTIANGGFKIMNPNTVPNLTPSYRNLIVSSCSYDADDDYTSVGTTNTVYVSGSDDYALVGRSVLIDNIIHRIIGIGATNIIIRGNHNFSAGTIIYPNDRLFNISTTGQVSLVGSFESEYDNNVVSLNEGRIKLYSKNDHSYSYTDTGYVGVIYGYYKNDFGFNKRYDRKLIMSLDYRSRLFSTEVGEIVVRERRDSGDNYKYKSSVELTANDLFLTGNVYWRATSSSSYVSVDLRN